MRPLPGSDSAARRSALISIEAGILGACLLDHTGRQASIATYLLNDEDFISLEHREVFKSIRSLLSRGYWILDYITVIADLQSRGVLPSYVWTFVSSLGEGIVLTIPMQKRITHLRSIRNGCR
jgi:hypothetical protein